MVDWKIAMEQQNIQTEQNILCCLNITLATEVNRSGGATQMVDWWLRNLEKADTRSGSGKPMKVVGDLINEARPGMELREEFVGPQITQGKHQPSQYFYKCTIKPSSPNISVSKEDTTCDW